MAPAKDWKTLGANIKKRREVRGLSARAAERAGGPAEPTWRRIEAGVPIEATSLYRICKTLALEESEAWEWFDLVGLDFDSAGYQRPQAIEQLISSLKIVKQGTEQALAAALQLEAENRSQQ